MTKIVKSEGCTAFYTRVDGKDLDELTVEEKEILLAKLIKIYRLHGINTMINLMLDNIEYDGESGGHCDQCGDTVYRQIYDLDDFNIDDNSSTSQEK
jgi:hypothetical protein